jgi:hypothetical protein
MELAGQLALLVFLTAFGATGGRLLWRGLRSDEAYERLLGVTYTFGGPLGYVPLGLAAASFMPPGGSELLAAFGRLNLSLSAIALYLFNVRVFRPASRSWTLATTLGCSGVVVAWLGLVFVGGLEIGTRAGLLFHWGDFWVRAGAYAWASAESLRQFVHSRRRLALGLADPVLVDRFRLWGIGMTAITGMFVVALFFPDGATAPLQRIVNGVLAAASSAAIWVSFYPPQGYRERLMASAPPGGVRA